MSRRRLTTIAVTVLAIVAAVLTTPRVALADTNLALGRPVMASSTDDPSNAVANAVDGNPATRWSSAYSDPQWIVVDLGSVQVVTSVTLRWEAAYGRSFQIQTSNDNATWATQFSTTTGAGGTQAIPISGVPARYVRMNGTARATQYGYSLFEFEVYGSAATNLAAGRPVTVSSTDDPSNAAANAVDGNQATRWSSAYSDPQWIVVDLGSARTITSVTLRWEAAYGRSFLIQTSNDNATWTNQFSTSAGTGGTQSIPIASVSARYVRMYGTARATQYGYSLFEFEVYGSASTPATNVARGKPVTVSSTDSTDNAAANAVDGNQATRWSSAYSDPQWIVVDLCAPATISSVTLRWEAAFGRSFQLQTSSDNATWVDRFSTTAGAGGTQSIPIASVSARYVRMLGTARGTQYGYSLFEFEVYGTGGGTCTVQPPPTQGPDLTGFTLLRDYLFGSGPGRNVGSLSALSANFNPYGIAGTTVINNEWQRYQTFNNTNHRITADRLELTATPNLGGISNGGISSGQITTKETFLPSGGRTYVFQLRAKVPRGAGTWPAFWMYAQSAPNTSSEIDIFEIFNSSTQNTFDWTGYDHGDGVGSDYHNIMTNQFVWHPGFDFAADYHTYTLVWKEGDIQKWVDGNWVKGTNFQWFGSPPQILINLALGGSPNSPPSQSGTPFPSVFSLDYLKVWVR